VVAQESDVSAVVLSIGEPTTPRALASLQLQTVALRDIIVIRDVRPFHKALNAAVAQVRTRFFVQVDADMILDPLCVAMLRTEMTDDAGIVVGHLRDELIGDVVGIKLFRTRCFAGRGFRNSISPDTDFGRDIAAAAWKTVYAGAASQRDSANWTMFGDHHPNYTTEYTYKKFLLEGRRYRYRDRIGGIRWHFDRLEKSPHPSSLVAQIALARGIFIAAEEDCLGTLRIDRELEMLHGFLGASEAAASYHWDLSNEASLQNVFNFCYRAGQNMFHSASALTFGRIVGDLHTRKDDRSWIAKVALCRGLFAQTADEQELRADWITLRDFMHPESCV
jgi:hypothetical protein